MTDPVGDHQSAIEAVQRGGALSVLLGFAGFLLGKILPGLVDLARDRAKRRHEGAQTALIDERRKDLDHRQDEIVDRLEKRIERLEHRLELATDRENLLRERLILTLAISESDRRTIERSQAAGLRIDLQTFMDLPEMPDRGSDLENDEEHHQAEGVEP